MTDSAAVDESDVGSVMANDEDADNQYIKALRVDSMISISVDVDIDFCNSGDGDDSAEHTEKSEPDADSVFSRAVQGLLEGLFSAVQLSDVSHVDQDGDLQFLLDQEPPLQDNDRHGAALGLRKKKEKASKSMAHMVKNGNSRSPSRASSRAASRVGGAGGSTAAPLRQSVLAIKLAKLSFQTSPLSKPACDPFHITPWDESSTSSEVQSQTSASHKTHSPGKRSKIGPESGDVQYQQQWGSSTDNSARGPLCTASISRVLFDFKEVQRREEIASDIDTRETRQRIAREVHRKGDLKLKLRSLADPTISLEKEEALTMSLLARKGSTRGGFRPLTRGDSVLATAIPIADANSVVSPSKASIVHPGLEHVSRGSTTNLVISENSITFRKEDYDGLQSDVVMLDRNGELLVGENCFLVAKKPRQDLLLDLFQKSTIEPRVYLPSSLVEVQELPSTIAAGTGVSEYLTANKNQVGRQLQSCKSPTRASKSRNSPRGCRVPSIALQDALFDGQRGSFKSFPRIELDPQTTPLTKGVTLKVDETTKRKASIRQSKAHVATPAIEETQSNDPLENQLKAMMLKSTEKQQHRQNNIRKSSSHQLSSRIDFSADPLSNIEQQQASPDQSIPGTNGNRPQSKHHVNIRPLVNSMIRIRTHLTLSLTYFFIAHCTQHQSPKNVQNTRTRTPALRHRMSRKALLKPEFSEFDESDLEFGDDHFYSLQEVSFIPKVLHLPTLSCTDNINTMCVASHHQPPQNGGPTSLPKVKKSSPYQREFPSPPNGRISIVSAARTSALTSSTAALPFPFTALPTVLKGRR